MGKELFYARGLYMTAGVSITVSRSMSGVGLGVRVRARTFFHHLLQPLTIMVGVCIGMTSARAWEPMLCCHPGRFK
jgi:hypothetical protein